MMMDWDSNEEEQQQQQQDTKLDNHIKNNNNNNNDNSKNNEEGSGNNNQNQNQSNSSSSNVMYVKVMTDEQMETLRKQIAAYATICDRLVLLHKSLSAHQDLSSSAPGRLGSLYCDPLMASGGHKITARQRWTPTPVQLQTLERIFDQGNGTPSKQKIKEITADLSQHGQISETNVYNWFQNRRARSKRKQLVASSNNNGAESEVETEVDSLNEKNTKPEIDAYHSQRNTLTQTSDDLCFQAPEISSELHFLGDDHLTGKMGASGNYSLYAQPEDYGMTG